MITPSWLHVTPTQGSGNGSFTVSADENEGIDRTGTVRLQANGIVGYTDVTVNQVGKREIFNASDGGYLLNDGGTFNVLKN